MFFSITSNEFAKFEISDKSSFLINNPGEYCQSFIIENNLLTNGNNWYWNWIIVFSKQRVSAGKNVRKKVKTTAVNLSTDFRVF